MKHLAFVALYFKFKGFSASKFYGNKSTAYKSSTKKGNPDHDLEIRYKKSHTVRWVRLGKYVFPSLIEMKLMVVASRLNDQHINYAQTMIKCQFSLRDYSVLFSKFLGSLHAMNYKLFTFEVIIEFLSVPCFQRGDV